MSAQIECPICIELIDCSKNCVTTECGHCFHTNCLMKNVAHNGFDCPYCRIAMAVEIQEEESSEYDEDDYEEEIFDDYALRGLRFFFNNLDGVEHCTEDIKDEEDEELMEEAEEEEIIRPSSSFITQKLIEQGVTMEQLVKVLLLDHDEYEKDQEEFVRSDDDLFGKLRIIISNYKPEQDPEQEPTTTTRSQEEPTETRYRNITFRRNNQLV